jgi:hypothetical protein
MFHKNISHHWVKGGTHGYTFGFFIETPLKVKKVEERWILIRLRVSGSTSLEIRVRDSKTEILVNKETTSKLTMRSSSSW